MSPKVPKQTGPRKGEDPFSTKYISNEFVQAAPFAPYVSPTAVSKIHKVNFDLGSVTSFKKLSVLVGEMAATGGTQRLDIRLPSAEEGVELVEPITTGACITGGAIIAGAIIEKA